MVIEDIIRDEGMYKRYIRSRILNQEDTDDIMQTFYTYLLKDPRGLEFPFNRLKQVMMDFYAFYTTKSRAYGYSKFTMSYVTDTVSINEDDTKFVPFVTMKDVEDYMQLEDIYNSLKPHQKKVFKAYYHKYLENKTLKEVYKEHTTLKSEKVLECSFTQQIGRAHV